MTAAKSENRPKYVTGQHIFLQKYLCTDIHWHLRPCLTVMWLATRPYKHEQICSMTARLCFNIYYETGSKIFCNFTAIKTSKTSKYVFIMAIYAFIPLFLGNIRGWEWIIILVVVLLLFGGKKIPELMRGIGKGISSFKEGLRDTKNDIEQEIRDDRK